MRLTTYISFCILSKTTRFSPNKMSTEQKNENETWEEREKNLLAQIKSYEEKDAANQQKISNLENQLKSVTAERDNNQAQIDKLQKELADLKTINPAEIETMKEKSEEMLTRAKELLFEKTKICKNQELQMEALHQQISSLKDVVRITKDLLNIRNMETQHLQDKLDAMESKIGCEKEKHQLMYSKLENMVKMNTDLKREYEAQLCLFNALREKYAERELARNVVDELKKEVAEAAAVAAANNKTTNENHDNNASL